MIAEAAKQKAQAKDLTIKLKALDYEDWTTTHSFYAYMNGSICEDGAGNWRDLDFTGAEDLSEIDASTIHPVAEILDRSKADCFAKLVVCCQILYLVPQCVGRPAQHMPISTLEVATIAYATLSLIAYAYWWEKPYCVHAKTRLLVARALRLPLSWSNRRPGPQI